VPVRQTEMMQTSRVEALRPFPSEPAALVRGAVTHVASRVAVFAGLLRVFPAH